MTDTTTVTEATEATEAPAAREPKVTPRLKTRYREEILPALKSEFDIPNVMQVPGLTKIVVNMGVGEAARDSKLIEGAVKDLTAITGQKPTVTRARKSIAQFKLREEQRVIVEGVNRVKRHTKVVNQGGRAGTTGGIITTEAPIHVSNVMLVEGKGVTRLGFRRDEVSKRRSDGSTYSAQRSVRVSRKTGKEI